MLGVGRAAWTGKELREILNKLGDDVAVEIDPAELALTERPQDQEEMAKARVKKRCVDMLRKKLKANEKEGPREGAGKTLALRFCLSPTELLVPPPLLPTSPSACAPHLDYGRRPRSRMSLG